MLTLGLPSASVLTPIRNRLQLVALPPSRWHLPTIAVGQGAVDDAIAIDRETCTIDGEHAARRQVRGSGGDLTSRIDL